MQDPAAAIQTDLVAIARAFAPNLADAIAAAPPLSLIPRTDISLAEALCRSVAGQQLSVIAARTIWGRVTDAADGDVIGHVARAAAEDLRACGLSGAKAKAMQAIAAEALAGRLEAADLGRLDTQDRTARLTALWGVGQWTADMIGMFHFADPDIWPDGDVSVRKTLTRLTSPRRKTVRTAARFKPYRSYLALYMWHTADAVPVDPIS